MVGTSAKSGGKGIIGRAGIDQAWVRFRGPLAGLWGGLASGGSLVDLLDGCLGRVPVPDATSRDFWNGTATAGRLLNAADAVAGKPWPQPLVSAYSAYFRTGNRTGHEMPVAQLRARTISAVLAACVEPSEFRVLEAADGLELLCGLGSWCWAAHDSYAMADGRQVPDPRRPYLDLGAGEVAALAGWAVHLLGRELERVVPGLVDRLRSEVRRRVLVPFVETRDWHWLGLDGDVHNWNPWIHSNVLAAGLFLARDQAERGLIVSLVVEGIDRFLAVIPADGGIDEGYSYWWNGAGRLLECLEMLEWATAGVLTADTLPALRELVQFPQRMQLSSNWFANFADGPARPSAMQPWDLLHRWGQRLGLAEVCAFAAGQQGVQEAGAPMDVRANTLSLGRAVMALSDSGWQGTGQVPPILPGHVWLDQVEVLAAREVPGSERGLALAAKGGHNGEHHNHCDVGSYLVAVDGVPAVIDLGQPTYTAQTFGPDRYSIFTMRSEWHNTASVGEWGQGVGRQFAAKGARATDTIGGSSFEAELADAYPAGAGLDRFRRTIQLERHPGIVRVSDTWECAEDSGPVKIHHILAGTVEEQRPGQVILRTVAGKLLALDFDAGVAARVETRQLEDPSLSGIWGTHVHRLTLEHPPGSGSCTVTMTVPAART